MGESKTICHLCGRKPGERHKVKCARGKLYRTPQAWRKMRDKPRPAGYPIGNIYDCVAGPLKLKAIPKGTPTRVKL